MTQFRRSLKARRELALAAYWGARSHWEEHAAIQRMLVLGLGAGCDAAPCMEPECVALRAAEYDALMQAQLRFRAAPSCRCVAVAGELCPLTLEECRARSEAFQQTDVPLSERGFGT